MGFASFLAVNNNNFGVVSSSTDDQLPGYEWLLRQHILFHSTSHPAALRSPEISEIIVLEIETLQFVLVPCALIIM